MHHGKYRAGMRLVVVLALLGVVSAGCQAEATGQKERIRAGTYNIEHFMMLFDQIRMPERSREETELFRDEEDLYEIARVIRLDHFDPDILAIQECCDEEMLRYFNEQWLKNKYSYVKVFKGNTEGQYLGIMAKKGFEPLEVREYYREIEPSNGKPLFSRGPGYVLFRTPGGRKLWVGCTHVKSKSGNSKGVTDWRIREVRRTRQICGELLAEGKADGLVMLGDFNDDFGMDRYEESLNIDAVAVMLEGKGKETFICADEPLWKGTDAASYHCEIKPPTYRSFLDHIFVDPATAKCVSSVAMIDDPIAAAASDHYPLLCVLELAAGEQP